MTKTIILTHQEIEHKARRMAYQIYETFDSESEIVIAGISKSGFVFAQMLAEKLSRISNINVIICEVEIDKQNPSAPIKTSLKPEEYSHKGLVLVDDVLNSGATLVYGGRPFRDVPLKKCKTAALVDRNHKNFPVKADFKGISLSTSLMEHVQVVFEKEGNCAYLTV